MHPDKSTLTPEQEAEYQCLRDLYAWKRRQEHTISLQETWSKLSAAIAAFNAMVDPIINGAIDLPMPEESKQLDSRDDVPGQRL